MKNNPIKQGSFTVEASFIIPFILFVIFSLCYQTFFLYDRIVMAMETNRFLRKAETQVVHLCYNEGILSETGLGKWKPYAFLGTDYREVEERLVRDLKETLQKKLMDFDVNDCCVEMKSGSVWIRLSGMRRISIPIVEGMLGNGRITFEEGKDVFHPCEFVRRVETISEVIQRE